MNPPPQVGGPRLILPEPRTFHPGGRSPAGRGAEAVPARSRPRPQPRASAGTIDVEVVKKVKHSTVYLRVELPDGDVAQGSGFFGGEPGIVVTNAHVLGMLGPSGPPRRSRSSSTAARPTSQR